MGFSEPPLYTRAAYMADSHTEFLASGSGWEAHRRYYGQFVTPAVVATVVRVIGADRLLRSTDPHLNDVSLVRWDMMAPANVGREDWRVGVKLLADLPREDLPVDLRRFRKANGTGGVSLSDYVCIAKEAARQWIEKPEVAL